MSGVLRENGTAISERFSRVAMLEQARAIAAEAGATAATTESDRCVPKATIAALHDAGLFRLYQPARFGGFDRPQADVLEVTHLLARQCGSTGWVYTVLAGHAGQIARMPIEVQTEVWDENPRALAASSLGPNGRAVPTDGGVLVSGRFSFASGCDHAQWALLGARIEGAEPGSRHSICLVRLADLVIDDDWRTLGLCGTGSKTLVADNVYVPARRVVAALPIEGTTVPNGLCAATVGIAAGAIDRFIAAVMAKPPGTYGRAAAVEALQINLAHAAAEADAAWLLIRRDADEAREYLRREGRLPLEIQARNRRDHGFAAKLAIAAVDRLYHSFGASGIYTENALQRSFRDVHAAALHVAMQWEGAARQSGRILLGEPYTPAF